MTLRITAQDVRRFSLDELRPWARDNLEFYGVAGREHYRLLAYISTKVWGTIIDIGTHRGASALALSFNEANRVLTFDIEERTPPIVDHRRNVVRLIEDLTTVEVREKHRRTLLDSPLILIDIDPHEGAREQELLVWLRENDYRGIVLLDDVWQFKEMREKVWYRIQRAQKIDLSSVGHWSGTGLVAFGERPSFDEEPGHRGLDNWTLVTGYFDLTGEPDASPELKSRPPEWYLEEHSSSTLALEHNLVVFTEPKLAETIWRKRPEWLHERTQVITQEFSEFPLFKYREEIWKNRGGYSCARDPRNTASYYLFCMARSAMLKRAMNLNDNSHFAWINICIERMGIRNVMALDDALSLKRNGFSTCRIGYAQPSLESLGAFYGSGGCADASSSCGGCTFCSGFYTGDRETMRTVCDDMEMTFLDCLRAGYGHADEQIMALVHARRPELFNWYPGDYAQMITNYSAVRERPEAPLVNLVLPAVAAGDWEVAGFAAERIWLDYLRGSCELSEDNLNSLLWAMREVRKHT